jgi:hypothetical protein
VSAWAEQNWPLENGPGPESNQERLSEPEGRRKNEAQMVKTFAVERETGWERDFAKQRELESEEESEWEQELLSERQQDEQQKAP